MRALEASSSGKNVITHTLLTFYCYMLYIQFYYCILDFSYCYFIVIMKFRSFHVVPNIQVKYWQDLAGVMLEDSKCRNPKEETQLLVTGFMLYIWSQSHCSSIAWLSSSSVLSCLYLIRFVPVRPMCNTWKWLQNVQLSPWFQSELSCNKGNKSDQRSQK